MFSLDDQTVEKRFEARPESAAAARQFVLGVATSGSHETDSDVLTMVSELATNAILHAATEFDVRVLRSKDRLRVEVEDRSANLPATNRNGGADKLAGRGLIIVEALSDRWGVNVEDGGKTVWFETVFAH